jgi:aldose 1-epimerase
MGRRPHASRLEPGKGAGRGPAAAAAAAGVLLAVALGGCRAEREPPAAAGAADAPAPRARVTVADLGTLPDGRVARVYTLINAHGLEARITDYGGIVLSLLVPDRDGILGDVVLGYDDLAGYLEVTPYFGAIVGRYGNRIAGARFSLDGVEHALAANDGPNHLHGGEVGFDKVLWSGEPIERDDGAGVALRYRSADGEEGYPGTLDVEVDYVLDDRNQLVIDYRASTDAATPVNLTHHSYFNLAGKGDVLGHRLTVRASRYTPVDATLIPTGELAPVEGTPFDFREPVAIGARIDQDHEQLERGGGYDHNFVLDREDEGSSVSPDGRLAAMAPAARVTEPTTGRVLEVETTEPGLQLYSGNFLDGTITGKGGTVYRHRTGFCLETQHFPDSPNQPAFPSTILRPGEQYRSRTIYRFGVEG